jgi:proteasome beta subunit
MMPDGRTTSPMSCGGAVRWSSTAGRPWWSDGGSTRLGGALRSSPRGPMRAPSSPEGNLVTVVLALRCADGMVLGSDSQVTESDRGMSYPARKLHPLGEMAAWGGSGARSVLHDLEMIFEQEAAAVPGARDVAHALQERMVPVLRRHYDLYIPEVPGGEVEGSPSAYLLAAGYSQGEPFIVKVDPTGLLGRYEEVGFHAIGSGAPMAQQAGALIGHYQMGERDVEYGVLAVVRVLEALRISQPMVGGPLNLVRLTADGAHFLDDDAVEEAREQVERWKQEDQRTLDRLFDGDGS